MLSQNQPYLIDLHDDLHNYLAKIDAMLFVLASVEFDDFDNQMLRDYLDAVSDNVHSACIKQEELHKLVVQNSQNKKLL